MSTDIEIANQQLINALRKDTKIHKKLEKQNKIFKGYDPEMRRCHEENSELLENYINKYGWPLPSKFYSGLKNQDKILENLFPIIMQHSLVHFDTHP